MSPAFQPLIGGMRFNPSIQKIDKFQVAAAQYESCRISCQRLIAYAGHIRREELSHNFGSGPVRDGSLQLALHQIIKHLNVANFGRRYYPFENGNVRERGRREAKELPHQKSATSLIHATAVRPKRVA
jgi:hypothetical protein